MKKNSCTQVKNFNFLNLIRYTNIDSHHIFSIFGIIIKSRYKNKNIEQRKVSEYGLNTEERSPKIIVSLTTFPKRIKTVHITIEQLLTQSVKPDKLILWLAEEQFPNKENDLPEDLLRLREFGLTIGWCKDLRSYKKLLPTLKEYPKDIIITYDDDIYYEKDSIKKLYEEYLKNPKNVYTHRGVSFYVENDTIKYYSRNQEYFDWKKCAEKTVYNKLTGCGGVLYPPHSLHADILNEEKIKQVLPTQDDVWFWAMAVLNKTPIRIVDGYSCNLPTIEDTQNCGLCKINKTNSTGLTALEAMNVMVKEYPEIMDILKENK